MAKHKNKFSDRRHSVGGVISTVMAVASLVMFVMAVHRSYGARGEGDSLVGSYALSSMMFAFFGLITGLMSYKEPDRYHTFSFIGSLTSGIMTVLMIMLYITGLS